MKKIKLVDIVFVLIFVSVPIISNVIGIIESNLLSLKFWIIYGIITALIIIVIKLIQSYKSNKNR